MLNRFLIILLAVFVSMSSFAMQTNEQPELVIKPLSAKITEPFTALAIAHLQITNNTKEPLKIKKITSKQARHVDIYKKSVNSFGAEQFKRTKGVLIPAGKTTEFNNGDLQIRITGLKRKYMPDEEIDLSFEFDLLDKAYITYLPAIASYR